ncbi:MAG TPA: thioredoxin family protein [Bacteroides reticulotermitis]|nr:thioredoxin family protein [Bacteroides reticulotermitis]
MKRHLFTLIMLAGALSVFAQGHGVQFVHKPWKDIVAQAKAENKLIFIDFYTQWCGPCLNMAQQVFSLPEVGYFYNQNFINAKIDAEEAEGSELAKKYGVRSYPTYAFIAPDTEEMVHRSSSRQTAEQFIATGQGALQPELRSFYLEREYQQGNRKPEFLMNYIRYEHSIYAREQVSTAFDELINGGAKLTQRPVWDLFVGTISGLTPYLKQVSDQYAVFCQLYGQKEVDAKLAKETTYGDLEVIEKFCNFEGKLFNSQMIRIQSALRAKKYDEVIAQIDALIADPAVDQQALIERLKFIARLSYYQREEIPQNWFDKCVEYLQYIAYNQTVRDDASIHQEYAAALEEVIRRQKTKESIPACLTTPPAHGKTVYNLRPDALKMKPRRNK